MDVWKRKLKVHFFGLFGVSTRWISNFASTTFHSTLRLKIFFCSGCPISQLHVFGDDLSSVNWGYQSILHIPAINHIVRRVPAINSITPTIHSPIDRFFGFQTLPRRQLDERESSLFFFLNLYWVDGHSMEFAMAHRYIYIYTHHIVCDISSITRYCT